jgi:uncharacterized protein YjcR
VTTTRADEAGQKFLSNEDLASRYGVSLATVRDWRRHRTGPIATKVGALVRYALADVIDWERQNREASA